MLIILIVFFEMSDSFSSFSENACLISIVLCNCNMLMSEKHRWMNEWAANWKLRKRTFSWILRTRNWIPIKLNDLNWILRKHVESLNLSSCFSDSKCLLRLHIIALCFVNYVITVKNLHIAGLVLFTLCVWDIFNLCLWWASLC